jgi:hypothetical protein
MPSYNGALLSVTIMKDNKKFFQGSNITLYSTKITSTNVA